MLAVVALALTGLFAPPGDFVSDALGREILGPRQSLEEARAFVESRIPKMPEVKTSAEWDALKDRYRDEVARKVLFRGEAASWRDAKTKVEWLDAIDGPGYRIKKLRYEAVPGLWIPALLYEPKSLKGKAPVVLNVNGHDSKGKAADYKQIRCINQAKRGILALNVEWLGMGQLQTAGFTHGRISAIDLCGTSGIATHFLAMKRGLNVLLSHEYADPARVGVTGLSGGGWQTIFISSLDPRVTLTDPVAGYSSFLTRTRFASDLGDFEQTPCDLATVVDYAHLTAMMAPNPTLLTFNAKDNCCFAAPHALPPLLEAAAPIFRLYGKESNLRSHVNQDPGDHNYGLDNRQALYRHLGQSWFADDPAFDPKEIPSESEVKSADALSVPLPDDNLDLLKLASSLSASLPHDADPPGDRSKIGAWQRDRRDTLRAIVRPVDGEAKASKGPTEEKDGITATTWKIQIAGAWTVPAVDLARGNPEKTVLMLSDPGRKTLAEAARRRIDDGYRVVAIDPFYFGEAKVADHDYLWCLMIATVGERPLGVQAGEVMAVARWLKKERGQDVTLAAEGYRTSTIALVAAALEPEAIGVLDLRSPLGSLKSLIDEGRIYNDCPELFCFGLLERFDIASIAALAAPRPITIRGADETTKASLGTLRKVYKSLGREADFFRD